MVGGGAAGTGAGAVSASRGHTTIKWVGVVLRKWAPKGTWVEPCNKLSDTWELAYEQVGYPIPTKRVMSMGVAEMANTLVDISNSTDPTKEQLTLFQMIVWRLYTMWNLHDDLRNEDYELCQTAEYQ